MACTADSIYRDLYNEDAACTKSYRQIIVDYLASQDVYRNVSRMPNVGLDGSSTPELGSSIKCFTSVLNPGLARAEQRAASIGGGGGELLDESADRIVAECFPEMTTAQILLPHSVLSTARRLPHQCPANLAGELVESATAFVGHTDRGAFAPSAQKLASGATTPLNIRIPAEPALYSTLLALMHARVVKARPPAVRGADGTVARSGEGDVAGEASKLRLHNILEWTNAALRPRLAGEEKVFLGHIAIVGSQYVNPAMCCSFCNESDIHAHAEPITASTACAPCAAALRGLHWVFATGVLCDARPYGKRHDEVVEDRRDARVTGREAIEDLRALESVLSAGGAEDCRQCDLTEHSVSMFLDEAFRDQPGTEAVSEVRRSVTAVYISAGAGGGVLSDLIKDLAASLEGAIDESEDHQGGVSYYGPGQPMVDFDSMDIDAAIEEEQARNPGEEPMVISEPYVPRRRTGGGKGRGPAKRPRLGEDA